MARQRPSAAPEAGEYAVYARLSARKPKRRREASRRRRGIPEDEVTVTRQTEDCLAFAEEIGVSVRPEHLYVDNNRSAWRQKGGQRPGWNRMMAAARRGEIHGILVWKLDRFTRAPRDLEDLIDLADPDAGGRMTITGPLSGKLDLTTSNGRKQARDAASTAAHESDSISERVRRVYLEARQDGDLMGGPRTFGYRRAGDPELHPLEASLLREAAGRMLAGETLAALAAEWNAQGVRTSKGASWDGTKVGRALRSTRHGGYVSHRGEIVTRHDGEPMFDPDTYAAVQAFLTSRRGVKQPSGRFLLSGGILTCSRCERPMSGVAAPAEYRCSRGGGGCGTAVTAAIVEEAVRQRVSAILADPEILRQIEATDISRTQARASALAAVDALEGRITDLEVKYASDAIPARAYEQASEVLQARRRLAVEALARLGPRRTGVGGAFDYGAAELYDECTMARKRSIVVALGVRAVIDPWQPGTSKKFAHARIHVLPELDASVA